MGFRFQTLNIYTGTLRISEEIFIIVRGLQSKRQYSFADQLFRACLSISNNIAEGSGSNSNKEFASYLNIARRSLFECVNMLIILNREGILPDSDKDRLISELDLLSKQIQSLRKTLLARDS